MQVAEVIEEKSELEEAENDNDNMGKICGGIHLKNFPEDTGEKKREKREALLTVIAACSDLSQEAQDRLVEAEVTVTKPERGK